MGTHINAPAHFSLGKRCMDGLANKALLLPLRMTHKQEAVAQDADYRLGVQDIMDFDQQYGQIPSGCFVAFASGWSKRWPDA